MSHLTAEEPGRWSSSGWNLGQEARQPDAGGRETDGPPHASSLQQIKEGDNAPRPAYSSLCGCPLVQIRTTEDKKWCE